MTDYWNHNPFLHWNSPVKVVWGHERKKVPRKGGIYAWFMPLRFYEGLTAEENIKMYAELDLWDGNASRKAAIDFNWDRIEIEAKRSKRKNIPSTLTQLAEPTLAQLEIPLLLSSVFARPLYVGKTDNLRDRIENHTDTKLDVNDFNTRFSKWVATTPIAGRIDVSDLLFVFLPLDKEEYPKDIVDVLEAILHHVIGPPLSLK